MALENTPTLFFWMAKTVFSFNSLRVYFITHHGDRDEGNACNNNTNIIISNTSKK